MAGDCESGSAANAANWEEIAGKTEQQRVVHEWLLSAASIMKLSTSRTKLGSQVDSALCLIGRSGIIQYGLYTRISLQSLISGAMARMLDKR